MTSPGSQTVTGTLTIDGRGLSFEHGQTILEVADAAGIAVPTLCYLPEAGHRDVCRLCVVDVAGVGRLLPACSTPATDGMVIETDNERVRESRRVTLELLIGSGQHTCITCEALGSCRLSQLAYEYGVEPPRQLPEGDFPRTEDDFLVRDYSKCILCGRCWAACTQIQVHGIVPHPSGRRADRHGGKDWYPLPDVDQCDFCGQCVDACPVGALTERRAKGAGRTWELERIRTTCPHCGMGCQTVVHVKGADVVKVTGAGDAPPNRGRLCRRGRFAVYEPDQRERLTTPLVRRDGELQPATWDEALAAAAHGLASVIERLGPDGVAGLVSPTRTDEDAYQAQKFFRAAIGTNNVDHRSPAASRAPYAEPSASAPGCYPAGALAVLEQARAILVVGDGDIDDYPVAGAAVRRAVREGGRLVVIDAGHNTLGGLAETHVSVPAGAVPEVLNALVGLLLGQELAGRAEDAQVLPHLRELQSLLSSYLPEAAADAAGVPATTLRAIAADLTRIKPAVVCAALGEADDTAGTWAAVVRLQALLDDVAGARTVTLPHGGGNVRGLVGMGVLPGLLPGHVSVTDDGARERLAEAWGVATLPASPGRGTAAILDGITAGEIAAVWVSADEADAFGDGPLVLRRLRDAGFVVAQSAVRGDLARVADVVLPSVSWGEEDGTFVNAERRVSRVRRVRRPPGEARPGWWIFREAAARLGHVWPAPYPEAVWSEIAALTPGLEGVGYADLDQSGLCWHVPAGEEQAATPA